MPRDRYDDEDEYDDRPRRRRDEDDDDRPRRRREYDDEDDRPRRSRREYDDDRPAASKGNGMAVASLILGILAICFGPITGVIGGILGLLGLRKPSGKGMAIAGLLLGGLFTVTHTVGVVYLFMEGQKRRKESNNYKHLGLATHNYESAYGSWPRPFVDDGTPDWNRKPNADYSDRLGWRVTLLPYIEQENVYRQFKLNEPWNSTTNQPLSNIPIVQYADVDTPADPSTRLRCFYDNGAVFDTRNRVSIAGITDGTSNTILYVEGADKVTWSRFQEYKFDPNAPLPPLGKPNNSSFMVTMCDGSVRSVRKTVSETTLKAMITRAGGEVTFLDD